MKIRMRKVHLKEEELKFIVEDFEEKQSWEREFIVFQWYETSEDTYESKIKIIFDLKDLSNKIVRVEKNRESFTSSNKTVTYLNENDLNLIKLLGLPFVGKRRSIKGDLHLDRFIYSVGKCEYLLELENPSKNEKELASFKLKDVTMSTDFHNRNLAIPFTKDHLLLVDNLIKILH